MPTRLTTTLLVVTVLLLTGQVLAQVPNFQRGQVLTADELNRIVDQVNKNTGALGGGGGTAHAVVCPSETIADAISQAHPGDTITISGTCNETVVVDKDGITLDGGGTAVIDGNGADVAVIAITGHQNVTIKGVTVQNGSTGILVNLGGAARLEDVTARNNQGDEDSGGGYGIRVHNSASVVLAGTVVADGNGRSGLSLIRNSSLTADSDEGATIHATNNTSIGIAVCNSSVMTLDGASLEVTGNDWGLVILGGSAGSLANTSAAFNGNRIGIGIYFGSTARFDDESSVIVNNNSGKGVSVVGASTLDMNGSLEVNNNSEQGVSVYDRSGLNVSGSFEANNNAGRGVDVWFNSRVVLTDAMISNNNFGILINDNATLDLYSSTITGNDDTDIYAGLGTILRWSGGQIGTVDCDDSTLTGGDAVCP